MSESSKILQVIRFLHKRNFLKRERDAKNKVAEELEQQRKLQKLKAEEPEFVPAVIDDDEKAKLVFKHIKAE